jgi:hypothetical protein
MTMQLSIHHVKEIKQEPVQEMEVDGKPHYVKTLYITTDKGVDTISLHSAQNIYDKEKNKQPTK